MSRFPTTRWTLLLRARESPDDRRAAQEELCAAYWRPLYVYARGKGLPPEAAEDAVQGFFVKLLEHDPLDRLDPARGRLRSYLRTAMDHWLATQWEKEGAQKRGGAVRLVPLEVMQAAVRLVPLDVMQAEEELALQQSSDPGAAFDRTWALSLVERALVRLRHEYAAGTRRSDPDTVLRFFRPEDPPSYDDAARTAGMTVPQLKSALFRARRRFRELMREEVAATVPEGGDADDELRQILPLLSA
jgi:RNA polymerase sigma-70 factor (ECF subfamily)